jgi:hypothetical protein
VSTGALRAALACVLVELALVVALWQPIPPVWALVIAGAGVLCLPSGRR